MHEEPELVKRTGFFLPHWTKDGAIYHVVFRLRDSLPKRVLEGFEAERALLRKQVADGSLDRENAARLAYLVSERVDQYLDSGPGECLMKTPAAADLVEGTLRYFDGDRYLLHAWCVMPNHVHVVVQPLVGNRLDKITHSWKSYSAHALNDLLGRTGEVWHRESFDHMIRTEASYHVKIRYVLENPEKSKLRDWRWRGGGPKAETSTTD